MSKILTSDQLQVKLMNQLDKLQSTVPKIKKTILLYDLYNSLDEDQVYLNNIQVIAKVMLDKSLAVEVERIDLEEVSANKYSLAEEQNTNQKITTRMFQVEEPKEGQPPALDNINIYELEGGDVRIVVIPVQESLIDVSKFREKEEQLEKEDITIKEKWRLQCLQSQKLKEVQKKWDAEKAERFEVSCQQGKEKHLKMFRIEALVGTVLQKTETVSICCLVDISQRRYKDIAGFQKEFNKIFITPANVAPQFIFQNYNPTNKSASQAENAGVTTIFSVIKGKFGVHKFECLDEKYFSPTLGIRTKIYENMEKNNNKAIMKVIQDFVDNWNRITVEVASCIITVLKQVSISLKLDQSISSSQDLNSSSADLNIKDINAFTYEQIYEKYILKSLFLPERVKLETFYTKDRLKGVTPDSGQPLIPLSIQCLTFTHFFFSIIRQFSINYYKTQVETQNDQNQLLKMWKNNLKLTYELANTINDSFLRLGDNKIYRCRNMQHFFNFLNFTIDSMQKIKNITRRDNTTISSLKSIFDQLKPRKDKILSYIIANEKLIARQEVIHYYDLYLLIIAQNVSKDTQTDIEYIYLYIHGLKAYRIATQYIYDNQKLVDAIKSYALIALKYQRLNENKRQMINILQMERRMARLLTIVGQEEIAALIFFKNREMDLADKCFKQVIIQYKGNDQAKKFIEWGELFEKQFEWDLSLSYYRKAFRYALSIEEKQNALRHKLECNERMRRQPTEEEKRMHEFFLKDGDLIKFSSEIQLHQKYQMLRKNLKWDAQAGCTTIIQTQGSNLQDSYLQNMQKKPSNSQKTA